MSKVWHFYPKALETACHILMKVCVFEWVLSGIGSLYLQLDPLGGADVVCRSADPLKPAERSAWRALVKISYRVKFYQMVHNYMFDYQCALLQRVQF